MDKRIHLYRDKEKKLRTTISLEDYFYEYLSFRLGHAPDSPEALLAVTEWIQGKLFEEFYYDKRRERLSQWVRRFIVNEIVDEDLSNRRLEWSMSKDKMLSKGKTGKSKERK